MDSSQESSSQPPLKKQKQNPQSSQISREEQFQFSQSFNPSLNNDLSLNYRSIVIKKGDKIQKRISQLIKLLIEQNETILLMSSGESLQKLSSIIEILKLKLREYYKINHDQCPKFEQFNKLDFYETLTKKNEILEKTLKVPVLYTMIRSIDPNQGEFNDWTRQLI